MYLGNNNEYENKFCNYYVVDVKCKILVLDNDDPINSQIFLEKRIKDELAEKEIEFESMEISSEDIFNKTHYIKKNEHYVDCYFQKIETDSGYFYRTFYNEFKNNSEELISKVDHITIDGIDYIENDYARYRIFEIEKDHFKKLNDQMKSPSIIGTVPTQSNMKMDDVGFYEYKVPKISSENSWQNKIL